MARIVTGEELVIGDRHILPVLRVAGFGPLRRQNAGAAGMDLAMSRVVPVAVIERRGEVERRIPIPDDTGEALRRMLAVAAGVWVLLWMVRRWSRDR